MLFLKVKTINTPPTTERKIKMENQPFKELPLFKKDPEREGGFSISDRMIAIYITLRVLNKMRKILGLEVMLEYVTYSIEALEKLNKNLYLIATDVLEVIDIEKVYQEAKQK